MDTFTTLWNRALLRVPAAGPDLCQDLIRDAFNQLVERRPWSWMMKTSSFYPTTYTVTGTVGATSNSAVITGVGTNFTAGMVGFQFRIGGLVYPTYTVVQVPSTTSLVLDRVWVGPTVISQPFAIFQCYLTVPSDFDYFYSVTNPTANYRLNFNVTQADLDMYDPQRSQFGLAYALAYVDTTQNSVGSVGPVVQVVGTGAAPISQTTDGYSYPQNSVYTIEITTGGASGAAQFKWRQDAAVTSGSGVVTSTSPITLSNGVQAYFPVGTYVLGDVFVFSCYSDATTGVARYEAWPRPLNAPYVYPYQYVAKLPALSDDAPTLPNRVARRGDVLLEMALKDLALFPGTTDEPNLYHDINISHLHSERAEKLIYELERQDEEVSMKDLAYTLPYMGPWRDGSWLQTHAPYE